MIKKLNKHLLINKLKHFIFNKNILIGIVIGMLLPIMIFSANMLRSHFSFKLNGNENLLIQEERRKTHVVESEPVVLQMVDHLNKKNFSLSKLIENNSFLEMLKELHTNLVPFQPHDFRVNHVYLSLDRFFYLEDKELSKILRPEEISILSDIKKKADLFIFEKIKTNMPAKEFNQMNPSYLREKVSISLAWGSFLKTEKSPQVPKQCILNDAEIKFMKNYYNFRPAIPIKQLEDSIQLEFKRIVENYRNNPAKMASHLHMLVVDYHPFLDGNGRIARAVLNFVRITNGLSAITFMDRQEYRRIVHQSLLGLSQKDYNIFVAYTEELSKAR